VVLHPSDTAHVDHLGNLVLTIAKTSSRTDRSA
jgi:hypothetical protein